MLELESGTIPDNAINYMAIGPWHINNQEYTVTKVIVTGNVVALDGANLFAHMHALKTAQVNGIDLSNPTTKSIRWLFLDCGLLTEITGLEQWDTKNITDTKEAFRDCPNLTSLPGITQWNTDAVRDMSFMFYNDVKLNTLDLSGWGTAAAVYMNNMFQNCTNLKTIGNPGLDIPANADQTDMYKNSGLVCTKAGRHHWTDNTHTLDWQETPDSALSECTLTFTNGTVPDHQGSSAANDIPTPWVNDSIIDIEVKEDVNLAPTGGRLLFSTLPSLKTANLGNLYTVGNTDLFGIFWKDPSLTKITGLENWDTSAVKDMGGSFNTTGLKELDLSNWDTKNVEDMHYLFANCPDLETLKGIGGWETAKVTTGYSMYRMFQNDAKLTTLDLYNWDTTGATDVTGMLPPNLEALRLGKKTKLLNTSPNAAFADVNQAATWVDKSGSHNPPDSLNPPWSGTTVQLATRASTNPLGEYVVSGVSYSFPTACTQPGTHTWGTLTWSETLTGEGESAECVLSLDSGTVPDHSAGTTHDTKVPWTDDSVTSATVKPGVRLASNTGQATYAGGRLLFGRLPKVRTIDVTNLNGSGNTDMFGMFWQDPNLTTITGLKNLDTSQVTDMGDTFNLSNLTSLDVSGWDTHNVTDMHYVFDNNPNLKALDLNGWDTGSATSMNQMFPANLQALRLGKKTTLKNAAGNNAFTNMPDHTWTDKSGITSPAWTGNTSALAARAATASPRGTYIVNGFNYTFPPSVEPVSAIPLTGITREQLLRNLLLLLGAGILALAVVAVTRHTRNRWASRH
ncbi:MAG: BspA family leucine-rich repeat surface protein [Bifidobacterium sp.]|nr:BspA family leucine-rich repeat surface protein [Bifidobacterium sp.]